MNFSFPIQSSIHPSIHLPAPSLPPSTPPYPISVSPSQGSTPTISPSSAPNLHSHIHSLPTPPPQSAPPLPAYLTDIDRIDSILRYANGCVRENILGQMPQGNVPYLPLAEVISYQSLVNLAKKSKDGIFFHPKEKKFDNVGKEGSLPLASMDETELVKALCKQPNGWPPQGVYSCIERRHQLLGLIDHPLDLITEVAQLVKNWNVSLLNLTLPIHIAISLTKRENLDTFQDLCLKKLPSFEEIKDHYRDNSYPFLKCQISVDRQQGIETFEEQVARAVELIEKYPNCFYALAIIGNESSSVAMENQKQQEACLSGVRTSGKCKFMIVSSANADLGPNSTAMKRVLEHIKPDRIESGACLSNEDMNAVLQQMAGSSGVNKSAPRIQTPLFFSLTQWNIVGKNFLHQNTPMPQYMQADVPLLFYHGFSGIFQASPIDTLNELCRAYSYAHLVNLMRSNLHHAPLEGTSIYEKDSRSKILKLTKPFQNREVATWEESEDICKLMELSEKAKLQILLEEQLNEFHKKIIIAHTPHVVESDEDSEFIQQKFYGPWEEPPHVQTSLLTSYSLPSSAPYTRQRSSSVPPTHRAAALYNTQTLMP